MTVWALAGQKVKADWRSKNKVWFEHLNAHKDRGCLPNSIVRRTTTVMTSSGTVLVF
jgi:hypothetical protein